MFMGLIGIIIASLVNMFFRSSGMSMIISYIGVVVFADRHDYLTECCTIENKVDGVPWNLQIHH
jgi:hypothetical protein